MPKHIDDVIIRTDTDLLELWRDLMGPGGFGGRSLWHLFLRPDGHPTPLIIPVDDMPDEPDPAVLRNLTEVMTTVVDKEDLDVASIALLLSRPGPDTMTASDRAWGRCLRTAYPARWSRWPIHLATRGRVRVFAPDDLLVA